MHRIFCYLMLRTAQSPWSEPQRRTHLFKWIALCSVDAVSSFWRSCQGRAFWAYFTEHCHRLVLQCWNQKKTFHMLPLSLTVTGKICVWFSFCLWFLSVVKWLIDLFLNLYYSIYLLLKITLFSSSCNRLRPDKRCDCQVGHWIELMVSTESEISELYR